MQMYRWKDPSKGEKRRLKECGDLARKQECCVHVRVHAGKGCFTRTGNHISMRCFGGAYMYGRLLTICDIIGAAEGARLDSLPRNAR